MIPVTLVTPDRIDTLPVSPKALVAVENIARSSGTADVGYEVSFLEHGRQITIQNISAAAMQHIQRPQAFVQVVGELGGGQLHVRRSRRFVSPARPGMARIRWPRSRPCQCTRGRGFPGQWVRPPSRSRGGKTPQAAQGGHGFTVPSRRITCCTMSLCMFW